MTNYHFNFRGAQVDVRNKKGNSSLWLAANGGHLDVVQLLHSASADIDSQDNRKVSCLMAAFRKGHSKVVKWMVKHVSQFPSDNELTRYISTQSDKDLLKKCHTCMDIIRVAKERQAAEAAKNASNLLEEIDREKNAEESKKAAAARKREKKKRKKLEKLAEKGLLPQEEENKENEEFEATTEDEKEKTPELITNNQDSGIDANSQASSSEPDSTKGSGKMEEKIIVQLDQSNDAHESRKGKSKKQKNKKNNNTTAEPIIVEPSPPKEETPPPPLSKADKKKERVPSSETMVAMATPNLPTGLANGDFFTPTKETSKKNGRQRRGGAASSTSADESVKADQKSNNTSPNNNSKKRSNASLAQAVPAAASNVNREDAGWKEVVRKSKKVIVPANAISRVIGRGGCNINAIREMSGAHIEVEKLQGKGSSSQQTERTILIKGSAEATRQANNWIQQIINSPDKDMADILGKSFIVSKAAAPPIVSTIQSTVIINSNAKMTTAVLTTTSVTSGVMTPVTTKKTIALNAVTNIVTKPAAFPSKTTKAPAQSSGSTFAAVASGSGTDSFGMIQTGGTHPGTLAKANNNKKAKTPDLVGPPPSSLAVAPVSVSAAVSAASAPQPLMASENNMEFIGTFEQPPVKPTESTAKANLDSKDYSPFKSYTTGWGNANDKDDKNFASVAAGGIDLSTSTGDLAAKAPGYRISPSGGPLLAQTGWGGSVTTSSILARSVASTTVISSNYNSERSNSAPGSPIMPSPIGPPPVQMAPVTTSKLASTTSPGSEPDQYRTGSSLSSGIGLSPGSGTGLGNHLGGRSMTPDSDSMRTATTTLPSTAGRSGSMTMDKNDIFGVRPASSGSANSNFVVNPENLLNAAAQMASAFPPSEMDYLGSRQFNDFSSTAARFNNPPTSASFLPPTSKLNPNAPDFMRPSTSQDYRMRNHQQQQNLLNKNNFNMMSGSSAGPPVGPPPAPPPNNTFNRFSNSNNLPNILTNQGINAYLQSQANISNSPSNIDLSAFDTNILSGRSIKEINDLIAGTAGPTLPPPQPTQGPPPPPPQGPPAGQTFNYFNEPKFNSSRPIGSERSRLESIIQKPSNSPWDLSGLYDNLGTAPITGGLNNDLGGFLSGGTTLQQTLDAFNGFASQPQAQGPPPPSHQQQAAPPPPVPAQQQQDFMSNLTSPVMGMTPNVTPSKSDFGDYSVASGLPMMNAPPGSSSTGKKMGYLDQPPLGMAGRGDPASVRRNMVSSSLK